MKDFISSLYESPTTQLGAVVVFGVTLWAAHWYLSCRKLPPGPPALPLIGSLPWMLGDLRGNAVICFSYSCFLYDDLCYHIRIWHVCQLTSHSIDHSYVIQVMVLIAHIQCQKSPVCPDQ